MSEAIIDWRTEADAAEVLDLLQTVFDDTSPEWFEAGRTDPPYPESFGIVARADGRIVSHAEVIEMPVRYGDATLRMGAVSGVATLPEWRGRGLASAVMERAVAEMAARRVPLSLLMTGSPSFYARLGWSRWAPPGRVMNWTDARAMVIAPGSDTMTYQVTPYTPADLDEMMALYDRTSAGRPLTLLRPERYWRSVMRRWLEVTECPGQRNAVPVARRDGRLVAYCFAYEEEDAIYLTEVTYEDAGAVAPLVRAVLNGASAPEPQRLAAVLPWESVALGLMAASGKSALLEPFGMMWRINDLPDLLGQIQPVLEARLAARPPSAKAAAGARFRLAGSRAEVTLTVGHGRLEIGSPEGAAETAGVPICRLAQSDLVTLLLSCYPSTEWLAERGLPEALWPWLASLFPPAGGIFWLTDNF